MPRHDLDRRACNSDELRNEATALFIRGSINRRRRHSHFDGPIVLACNLGA
jgi:hypothetical protein